ARARAGALQSLPDPHDRPRLRDTRARRMDRAERARSRPGRGRCALLAGPGVRRGTLVQRRCLLSAWRGSVAGAGGRALVSALAVAVGLLAGGAGGRVQTPGASASGQAKAYRWLVRTAGSPPSIAAENRMPGTRAWRLPGPPPLLGGAARGAIAGYVSEQTVAAGQRESVYV